MFGVVQLWGPRVGSSGYTSNGFGPGIMSRPCVSGGAVMENLMYIFLFFLI